LEGLVDQETAASAASNRHDFEIEMNQALRRRQAAAQEEEAAEPEPAVEEPAVEEEQNVGLRLASPEQ
jgi:hypothetical protein